MSNYTGSVPDILDRSADWLAAAPCKENPDAMFPSTNAVAIEEAKAYCRRCTAVERCLQWALNTGTEHGVWGGLSEEERRRLRPKAVRPISIDEYTGTSRQRPPVPARTLAAAWEEFTEPSGAHLLWTGPKQAFTTEGYLTPNRLAFFLDRGRWPDGDTVRQCQVQGCVAPAHLRDRAERNQAKAAA